ncbi:ring finger domain containing protein [Nitzschia inconspicua]|uniref:Ring finger domain containing protein n=1 Tax=Nitzschia inconspicua TaxID=303405 RepID=A0A9K3KFI3_9STRA|nr:ring finger domain containing protein [Nitzschia inconspicua]KAG7342799.1 ring finger domain containing protein [Nitzschia inconspicua]
MTPRYELPDITVRQPPPYDEDLAPSASNGFLSPIMKQRCIIWSIILTVVVSFALLAWLVQRKRRIEASTEETATTITSLEGSTKNQQILTNPETWRNIYLQVFEVLGNQTELDKHNLRTVHAVDLEGGNCTVLSEDQDLSRGNTADDATVLVFHKDPEKIDDQSRTTTICAVCLDSYRTGDVIVWSYDPECCHVYHKECLVDYLSKRKNPSMEENPCPICRRNFCQVIVA